MSEYTNQQKVKDSITMMPFDPSEAEVLRDEVDEKYAKAKAWDLLKLKLKGKNKSILRDKNASDEDLDFAHNNTAVLWEMGELESGDKG